MIHTQLQYDQFLTVSMILLKNTVNVCGADLNFTYAGNMTVYPYAWPKMFHLYSFVTHLLASNIYVQVSHYINLIKNITAV